MLTRTLRSLVAEPRVPGAPGPGPRDWALVGIVVTAVLIEGVARPDLVWRPFTVVLEVALACTLPWRRVHPLPVLAVAFGTSSAVQLVGIVGDTSWEGMDSGIVFLLVPYALTRWGSGREVAGGCAVMAVPLAVITVDGAPAGDVVGGAVVLLLASALGAGARYQRASRQQELAGIRARERELLARELHDTVAHHVSAIAIQAQAGRALAGTTPGGAAEALTVIEEEASRTLEEMRSMVGALRNGDRADLAPQQGVADIERLARETGLDPRVEVTTSGEFAGLSGPVDAALYRLAQEAVTNALRHARHARLVRVRVCAAADAVRLTVEDDGDGTAGVAVPGFGLVGMAERAKLLGGTFDAGPRADGGWTVTAVLPRHGAAT